MVKTVSAVHIFYRANPIACFLKNLILEPSRRKTVAIYLVMRYPSAATFRRPFMANGKRLAFIAIGGAIDCFECCMTLRFGAATVWNYGPCIFAMAEKTALIRSTILTSNPGHFRRALALRAARAIRLFIYPNAETECRGRLVAICFAVGLANLLLLRACRSGQDRRGLVFSSAYSQRRWAK